VKFPNPNLLRFIRPTRLQLWCARRGVLTGRWTYAETERIRRSAADRYHRWQAMDPYDVAEFACPYDETPLVAPWQKCPKCGRND
jgi:hypothetical protein